MLGAIVRAAGTFIGAMLIASVLSAVFSPLLEESIKPQLGTNSLIYVSMNAAVEQFIVTAVIAVLLGVLVRSVVESKLGGGI
jgi:uncharacterized membrane protein